MEEGDPQVPIIRQVLLHPTGNDHAAGADVKLASLFFAFESKGEAPLLVIGSANALHLLGCHCLSDRGQLESDADGRLPGQGKNMGSSSPGSSILTRFIPITHLILVNIASSISINASMIFPCLRSLRLYI